ncbi:MAG: DUF551 domain-containing protein [bacterium]|nr:DUF551 domain-containing protein [bacterium]
MDWISVKDKLPAIDEDVIVFCGFQAFGTFRDKLNTRAVTSPARMFRKADEDDGFYVEDQPFRDDVTHWMPKFDDPNEYNVYRMRGKKCG